MKYSTDLIKGFLIFPLNVMGVIPALILWFTYKLEVLTFNLLQVIFGGGLIIMGSTFCWITVNIFTEYGQGTPAPWAPPKRLLVIGLYRYVRNPMMIGVGSVLMGESILLGSTPLLIWFSIFTVLCLVFIPLWEEPDLENRLGDEYRIYKMNVPRWFPRFEPWIETNL